MIGKDDKKVEKLFNGRYCVLLVFTLLFGILTVTPHVFAATTQVVISPGAGADKSCVAAQNCFDPQVVNISVGDTVTWANNDLVSHTITSGLPTDNTTGTAFYSSLITAGKTYSVTFQKTGNYPYFCQIHPWMTGEVVVEQGSVAIQQSSPETPALPLSHQISTNVVVMSPGSGPDQSCVATNDCFSPSIIQVPVGSTVTWQNNDKVDHTTTSGQPTDNVTGTIWDSSLIAPGKTYSFTFQNAGDYHSLLYLTLQLLKIQSRIFKRK
jgi:plastocyanin